jgi:glycosyltransferase involved in cell wall biosynthesis
VRGLLSGLEASRLPDWGVLAYPGPLPIASDRRRVAPVVPRRPRALEFHGGWVLDELLLPRRLRGSALFHATDPRRIPARSDVGIVATVYDLTPLHDAELWRSLWPDQRMGYRRAIANLRHAVAVVVISRVAANDVVDSLGIDRSRVHLVYPSVDVASAGSTGVEHRDPDHLLFVGAPDPHKNLGALLRALAALPASRRPALTVVGPWSERAQQRLRDAVGRLGLERVNVEADAPAGRLETLYCTVTALVIPSRREGFGLPLLEAMARGCPVVAADIPVFREVAAGAALHFAPGDPDALEAALERILGDGDQRRDLAEAGLRRAADFDPRQSTDALLRCYGSLGVDTAA